MPANKLNWMLWFEEDPRATPQAAVEAAAAYYRAKYCPIKDHPYLRTCYRGICRWYGSSYSKRPAWCSYHIN